MSRTESWDFGADHVPRKTRVGSEIAHALASLIVRLADPRLVLVTVTDVDMSPDLKQARVSISSVNPNVNADQTLEALRHAGGKLRRQLAGEVHLRVVPRLSFVWDHGSEEREHIDELIARGLPSAKDAPPGE